MQEDPTDILYVPDYGPGEHGPTAGARRWLELSIYAGLLVTALAMRLWDLGARALHHDESLHAYYAWGLASGDGYTHNPMMHGPLQFEANAAVFLVFGDSDYTTRLLYAVMGTALVALPYLLRTRLGRPGALMTAAMLAFSPTLLYFSRFTRNDILMAFWTLGLVIAMWRYLDEGKNRYLYAAAALIALAFTTKETSYMVTAILGLFLTLWVVTGYWRRIRQSVDTEDAVPGVAAARLVRGTWSYFRRDFRLSELDRPGVFLLLLVTLTLPQWSAAASLLQNTPLLSWSNLVLANPEDVFPAGSPTGGGLVIAFVIVVALLGLSVYWGYKWNWSIWWRCALIFYTIWVLLYSTFFTSIEGVGSGFWQGLGYWVAQQQQEVARGNQPWYYYIVLAPLYEYLPLVFGAVASIYYWWKRDVFGNFLVLWAAVTFALYTYSGEKMPWLLVNITLPLIVLSGRFLGRLIEVIRSRGLPSSAALVAPGVPGVLVLLWWLARFDASGEGLAAWWTVLVALALALGLAALAVWLARRQGANVIAVAGLSLAALLFVLSVRTGAIASYRNGDTPVEMIVYTQTTPDVPRLMRGIQETGGEAETPLAVPITVDSTSGFSWPWAWYLRNYQGVNYPAYVDDQPEDPPEASVLLVHSQNQAATEQLLGDRFADPQLVRHRWWFPESTYRNLTLEKIASGLIDRGTWRNTMDYFLYREGVRDLVGSEDAYVYTSVEFPIDYAP